MADPIWITPSGTLGQYGAVLPITNIDLEAVPVSPATVLTYTLNSGSLPNGLTLSNAGVISGTIIQDLIGSTIIFSVKATDDYGNSSVREFSITVIAHPPVWETAEGILGTFPSGYIIEPIQLVANSVLPAAGVYYTMIVGSLPPGLKISKLGLITGTPNYPATSEPYQFTIKAIDNLGNSSTRVFSIAATSPSPVWVTKESLGSFLSLAPLTKQLEATAVSPATTLTYKLLSGALPTGITLSTGGILSGIPTESVTEKTYLFVVRVTDNFGNISDRSFTMTVSGSLAPTFTTLSGGLFETLDSIWIEYPIQFNNPDPKTPAIITLVNGILPPGLEIDPNGNGLIRGYPDAPTVSVNLTETTATATATTTGTNAITVLTTAGFVPGRPIIFSGTVLGGLTVSTTYYVKEVLTNSTFTVSENINGSTVLLDNDSGLMNCTLPQTTVGEPTIKIYSFTLKISNKNGTQLRSFSIKVINQNTPISQNGPGYVGGTRAPVIYNTRPPVFNIDQDVTNYGFYVLPPDSIVTGLTYPVSETALIGTFYSGNFFAFKILGHDFENQPVEYVFSPLSTLGDLNLTADPNTGWITGYPTIASNQINVFNFSVQVRKKSNPTIVSEYVNFGFILANNITSKITWITDKNLGSIYNGVPSTITIKAESEVDLKYTIVDGSLPNNLTLLENGEIVGTVAFETTNDYVAKNAETVYTFTVNAYSDISPTVITSTKTFTITVVQEFIKPTDTLYIECTPSIADRLLINNLLSNNNLIPESYLYRPDDINFGKATNVTYVHAYGINASSLTEYIAAIQKNHYWRNVTLGPIKTAIARDSNNKAVYEVVYSEIVDNLVNPNGISVSEQIYWPFFIDLNLGPWYTSITDIYTSYIYPVELDIVTQDNIFFLTTQENQNLATNQGQPSFYTSLTPGYARILYPNSLENMRKRVQQELGYESNAALLPLWMTSQQSDGSTTGFVPAWVICYTKIPDPVSLIATKTTIDDNTITVSSTSNLVVGGKIVFSGNVLGDIQTNKVYYVVSIDNATNKIQISTTQYGSVMSVGQRDDEGLMTAVFDAVSYANLIQHNIENDWKNPVGYNLQLNLINFQIDRFTVNKSLTYDYDNNFKPSAWTDLPSGTPVPNPIDSKDFNVLFPQKTILPIKTQYLR